MNEAITIKIYNEKGEVTKEASAKPLDLRFGSVRKIMEILNIETAGDTYDLLKTVYNAWDEVTGVLGECYPEITPEEWDNVRMKELLPAIVGIVKAALAEIVKIPTDKKNA